VLEHPAWYPRSDSYRASSWLPSRFHVALERVRAREEQILRPVHDLLHVRPLVEQERDRLAEPRLQPLRPGQVDLRPRLGGVLADQLDVELALRQPLTDDPLVAHEQHRLLVGRIGHRSSRPAETVTAQRSL